MDFEIVEKTGKSIPIVPEAAVNEEEAGQEENKEMEE